MYTCCRRSLSLSLILATLQLIYITPRPTLTATIAPLRYVSHKDCNGQRPGTFVAHPTNCTQYIRCNGLRSILGDCPKDTYFNAQILSCDTSPLACKIKNNTTVETYTTIATTTASLTATMPPVITPTIAAAPNSLAALGRPLCTSWFDQQFPHPYNCEYYYYCLRGYLTVRRCTYGFGWDLDRQRCVPLKEVNCFKNFVSY